MQAQLRAKGEKPQLYSMREITLLAEDYFAQHREQIIKKAAEDVATFPEFARRRCAQLSNSAQTEEACNYSQIPVQKSGVAEWRTKNDRGLCACQH